ncbi:MAG: DUF1156 domain-containing protein [Sphaerochaeta sp.]|nr:DUF1156 domain-containing protein [Sphaerochaeta sp.]
MANKKKLIEVALPLEEINAASSREKSIRHGHPSTLHLWWARRPLATARAVIFSSLVDDPSSHPEEFPTEEEQDKERKRLFGILKELVIWENSNNETVLKHAKAEIMKSTDNNPPAFFDPFAGGGALPLEAQRLGLKTYASDLNPVAVMINKAMIEIPPKFQGLPAVNPESAKDKMWQACQGLSEDVRYYGNWMKEEAFKRIGHLYPKAKLEDGSEATVIAWIWARTVKCPNPACGCEMPLVHSYTLSKKKGKECHIGLQINREGLTPQITYHIEPGEANEPEGTVSKKGGAICPSCGSPMSFPYIREQGKKEKISQRLIAIVCESNSGRKYLPPKKEHSIVSQVEIPTDIPDGILLGKAKVNVGLYGLDRISKLFTNRQLTALTLFSSLISDAQKNAYQDAKFFGMSDDGIGLSEGGIGAKAYGEAIGVYLTLLIDKMTDYHSSICSWNNSGEKIRNVFGRQAIPMVWDYVEANPFSNSSGSFDNMLGWVIRCIEQFHANTCIGEAVQWDATQDNSLRNIMVSTDPPYYDNIGYADLSDFFYVWMRQSLRKTYPQLFSTLLVPKTAELVATPYRFDGSKAKAKEFFEDGMLQTCRQIYKYAREDIPVTIYYAFKQSESETKEDSSVTASSGWETMLSAIIKAGFSITGTWPMRTEMSNRSIASGANALASSIVLVCRKNVGDLSITSRHDFVNQLRRELGPALKRLQEANIAPVDLAQSSIGPGMGVFSRYKQVIEADGTPMTVRSALQIINQELDKHLNEQLGTMESITGFCLSLYEQKAFNTILFGDADTLARAKNTSVEEMKKLGVLCSSKGIVSLMVREDLQPFSTSSDNLWLITQQAVRAFEVTGFDGAASVLSQVEPVKVGKVKSLCYQLFSIADKNGWASEAYAYNNLIASWDDTLSVSSMRRLHTNTVQAELDFEEE